MIGWNDFIIDPALYNEQYRMFDVDGIPDRPLTSPIRDNRAEPVKVCRSVNQKAKIKNRIKNKTAKESRRKNRTK